MQGWLDHKLNTKPKFPYWNQSKNDVDRLHLPQQFYGIWEIE